MSKSRTAMVVTAMEMDLANLTASFKNAVPKLDINHTSTPCYISHLIAMVDSRPSDVTL
jgi:hypothetical protein